LAINLHYIRAAIEANTGVRLTLERTRELLVEEGLITQRQADTEAVIFRGYGEFFNEDYPSTLIKEDPQDIKDDLNWEVRNLENSR
tara:strand:- start:3133 stop:3390 length:258 start_codon:yes stop_codon:yes gene_type:complete